MVQFHLNHLGAFMLCCLQCAHLETSPSSYGSPSTGLKLFWFYNLQLLIPASWVLCWPENRVTWMLEESLGEVDVTYTLRPAPGTQEMTRPPVKIFCVCGGPAANLVRSGLQGPGALLPADPRVQL